MTYQQAVEYILDIPRFTTKNGLGHTRELLGTLGVEAGRMKVVHVAGTNGKGSVCAYVDAMLRAQGKRVGLFTSPHLVRMNERIVIGGRQISDGEFTEAFEAVYQKVGEMERQGFSHPTFFEFVFCMAMVSFSRAEVEYVVLETGLGGRLDATNAVSRPACCAITSIGRDHMRWLGDTVEEIAAEKAGIVKAGVPVVYMENGAGSDGIIEEKASEVGAPCKKIEKRAFKILETSEKHIAFSLVSQYYGGITWRLASVAPYQVENACLALEVMRVLFGGRGRLPAWRRALADVKWPGRMEEVRPRLYVDGAHNVSAVERFVETVSAREERRMVLFSAVSDKEYEEMIACLCALPGVDCFVVTQLEGERAVDVQELESVFRKLTGRPVVVKASPRQAWDYVLENQGGRAVYCLGSLYLAGMLKKIDGDGSVLAGR
jgi:dihydrofolate synthase/folylpolyglutamate synthase